MKWKGVAVWIALSCLMVPPGRADPLFLRATKQIAYQSALDDLALAINNHGYTPTKTQPVDQGLRAKGYEATDYKLIFFGDKEQLDQVLAVNPEAAMLLPLRIILYRDDDVVIAAHAGEGLEKNAVCTSGRHRARIHHGVLDGGEFDPVAG